MADANEQNFLAIDSPTNAIELLQGIFIDDAVAWSWELVSQHDVILLRIDGADVLYVYRSSVS